MQPFYGLPRKIYTCVQKGMPLNGNYSSAFSVLSVSIDKYKLIQTNQLGDL